MFQVQMEKHNMGVYMKICGLNKTTLLDYPGKVAATIFLGGCNFRCPFCQNSSLVVRPQEEIEIPREEIMIFLKKRKGILDGVCVSGGEPTLAAELKELLEEIKSLGYLVKLDTNGTRPQVIRELLRAGLVDFVAMDIKSSLDNYSKVSGIRELNLEEIQESAEMIRTQSPDYEFRTTVVRELHQEEDFMKIASWLSGVKAYYLQAYRDSDQVLQPGFHSYDRGELENFCQILRRTIPLVQIRGLD